MSPIEPGSVVVVPFPFSDLTSAKLRPALVLARAGRGDWICVQITSNPYADPDAIPLTGADFAVGNLNRDSFVRPGKLFTANQGLFKHVVGRVDEQRFRSVVRRRASARSRSSMPRSVACIRCNRTLRGRCGLSSDPDGAGVSFQRTLRVQVL